jgi:putative peptide zinc metalloprotease protein
VHYRRRVREFGFTMLHGFIPTFYADVTDIFMGTRRARIVASVSGPLVNLVLGLLAFLIASVLGPGLLKAFLAATAILQIQSLFVSLYPFCFLEMDGYHVLVDVLGMPTLNHDAVAFVRQELWDRIRTGTMLNRQELIYVAYVVLSAVSIAAFVYLNVVLITHAGGS